MHTTLTAVFRNPEAAERAAHELRENGDAGTIRLYLPSPQGDQEPLETEIFRQRSPWLGMVLWGLAMGIVFTYMSLSLSSSYLFALVALAAGVRFGVAIAGWLSTERFARTIAPHMRSQYLNLVRSGRAVLLVDARGPGRTLRERLEEAGAYVSEGYLPIRDTLQPV